MAKKGKKGQLQCRSLSVQESLEKFGTDKNGLSPEQVEERRKKYGKNELPGKKVVSIWSVILNQFKSPLIYILLAAGVFASVAGEFKDAGFIFFILVINAGLGTFQEWKAEKSAEDLQKYLKIYPLVTRNGHDQRINAEDLVPGDIVILKSGDKVPADLRLIDAKNFSVDESILTGESLPVSKHIRKENGEATISDCGNLAFAGTRVTSGRAKGIVIKTGLDTEVGKIAKQVASRKDVKPPLLVRMDKFAKQIGLFVLGGIAILAVVAITQGYGYLEVFLLGIALAVSAIPAGLPVATTVALSISSNRMAKRNVIIRKLAAVESLGSCTLISSDKTGTLTVNKQTAKVILTGYGKKFLITGEGYNDKGDVKPEDNKKNNIDSKEMEHFKKLAKAAVIVNEAKLIKKEGEWEYSGNPIDIAFLALSYKLGMKPKDILDEISPVGEIPFESENKYSATFYKHNRSYRVAAKGAAEVVIPLCNKMSKRGRNIKLENNEIKKLSDNLARDGYRVIAVAEGNAKKRKSYEDLDKSDIPDLNFLGLIGFMDPIRPDVKDSIAKAKQAGIKVVMITGDNPETAFAISKEIEIAKKKDEIITGFELQEIENKEQPENEEENNKEEDNDGGEIKYSNEFENRVRSSKVFARIAPLQKLKIVEVFKKIGNFVAVTGDGVNDTPALKRANIGVAMGSGTDVTKDTSSIIVTDDSFSSIVAGVEEGRFAYNNIRKVTYLLISTGAAEVILFIAALLAGLPLALVAIQLLWLNFVTNGIQDVALAFEKGEPGVMKLPPRKPTEGIFNKLMLQQVVISGITIGAVTFGVWYYLMNNGWDLKQARGILLLLMVLLQNLHVFNCRSERISAFKVPISRNYFLIFGVLAAQGIHIGAMYIPFMQNLLGIEPVSFVQWAIMLGIALTIILVMEIFKLIKNRLKQKYA